MQREPQKHERSDFDVGENVEIRAVPLWMQLLLKLSSLQERKLLIVVIALLGSLLILKGGLSEHAKILSFSISLAALLALGRMGHFANREM